MSSFAYIWQYRVRPERIEQFLSSYGENGAWVQLFSRAPGYLGTELLRDCDDELRFITIDHWRSIGDRDSFVRNQSAEYEALDRACESIAEKEEFVGDFTCETSRYHPSRTS